MKVLYIDVNCKQGSTGKIAYDLYTQCRRDGHEAAVCYGRGALIEEENIFKFGLDWETKLHAGLTRITGWTGCFSPVSTRRLLKFMDQFQPDVVHLHEPHAYFMNLKPFFTYLKEKNIPLVYTFHCEFAYTGKCGYAYDCEKWKSGCGQCPALSAYPKTVGFDFTAQMFRQKKALLGRIQKMVITAPSGWLADRARQSFLKDRDIRVVHNGIDTENVFHPREVNHLREKHGLTDEKVVLAVAPDLMSARKGGRWVLKLAEKFSDQPVKFVLVGVDDLSEVFPDNVIAVGRTANQHELAEYYSMADCFVICSEKETFSMTCAESLCCGTPIAGFCCGAPETIFSEPTAKFVPYGDLDLLVEAVSQQIRETFDREKISKNAQVSYGRKEMYQSFKIIYQSLQEEHHL